MLSGARAKGPSGTVVRGPEDVNALGMKLVSWSLSPERSSDRERERSPDGG